MASERVPSDGLDTPKTVPQLRTSKSTGGPSSRIHGDQNDPSFGGSAEKKSLHLDASDNGRPTWRSFASYWQFTIPLSLAFIAIAISSEVVLIHSQKNSGFDINLADPDVAVTAQLWMTFGPTFIFIFLFTWFFNTYNSMKLLQPYIDMSNPDGAPARDCVLVNYLAESPESVFVQTLTRHKWILCILSLIAIAPSHFFSLAGSYFRIISVSQPGTTSLNISGKIGLGYNLTANPYIPFVIAAGGLNEALRAGGLYRSNLYPYDNGDGFWMVPGLNLNKPWTAVWNGSVTGWSGNATVAFSAAGIQATCAAAQSIKTTGPNAQGSYQIVGTLPNNCSATSTVRQTSGWYGWAVLAPFACVHAINPNEPVVTDPGEFYHPIAFTFFKDTWTISMVFCYSSLVEHNVTVKGAFSNNYYLGINHLQDNGFIGSLGLGPNGLSFDNTGISVAVAGTLIDTILRSTGDLNDEVFGDSTLAVDYAQAAYLMYQTLLAPLTLVVGPTYVENANTETSIYRISANQPVAHSLTALCGFTGVILFALFLYHHICRKKIWLGASPSRIATVAALLSKSEFPKERQLLPSDDLETIEHKLFRLNFKLLDNGGVDVIAPPEGEPGGEPEAKPESLAFS